MKDQTSVLGDEDGVFAEWQKPRQSIGRRRKKSNLQDLAAHLNMARDGLPVPYTLCKVRNFG
ncbi:hypothetical protein MAR_024745 [Mya arenaria]|uniref:Uncharacterized protein n=1 Tax=Mya arenaria TaxID=6604 RepID=A0ABY7DRP5_MYAAR|nr:hypothetical protein MAR_024745 [Mya arenaria]